MDYKDAFAAAMITNRKLAKELVDLETRLAEAETTHIKNYLGGTFSFDIQPSAQVTAQRLFDGKVRLKFLTPAYSNIEISLEQANALYYSLEAIICPHNQGA